MPITGSILWRNIQQKSDQAYTDYFDNTKANRLLYDAYIMAVQQIYRTSDKDFQKDAISSLTTTEQIFIPNNNRLYINSLQISAVAYSGTIVTITTVLPHNILQNQQFTISGVTGVTGVNGTFFASVVTANTITFSVSIAPSGIYTANTGIVDYDNTIVDYWHLLTLKASFQKQHYGLTISAASNTTPIVIKTNKKSSLRTGEQVSIQNVLGNLAANGTYYIKSLNYYEYELYSDVYLQNGVAGTGTYVSGGIIGKSYLNYCTPTASDAKIGILSKPVIESPKYEIADNQIKIYPLEVKCDYIVIDYIKKPFVTLDVTDTVTDLLLYYSNDFLLMIQDVATKLFGEYSRDTELINLATLETNNIAK